MKTIITLVLSLVFASCCFAVEKTEEKNPIIGDWRWGKKLVTFRSDGSATASNGFNGAWKEVETKTVERKYTLSWQGGRLINEITLERSGKKLRAKIPGGPEADAEKID